jgi:hypothetical protein
MNLNENCGFGVGIDYNQYIIKVGDVNNRGRCAHVRIRAYENSVLFAQVYAELKTGLKISLLILIT